MHLKTLARVQQKNSKSCIPMCAARFKFNRSDGPNILGGRGGGGGRWYFWPNFVLDYAPRAKRKIASFTSIRQNSLKSCLKNSICQIAKLSTHHAIRTSEKAALATLFSVEKRFAKLPEMKKLYTEAIHDAIQRGHMELVEIEPENAHFIPHHAVLKDSSTTKLRIVHNASQKNEQRTKFK